MDIINEIRKYKVVPVVVSKTLEDGMNTVDALVAANLPVAEVTFRTSCAKDVIKYAVEKYKDALIGAGTILTSAQCEEAINSGAKFIVSPGLSIDVFNVCKKYNVPYFPGVVTPTEIIEALNLGLTHLKFFPANNYGGIKTIKALCAAFTNVYFMPTGGIDENNINDYLSFEKIFACGGSFMVKGTKEEIIEKTTKLLEKIK